MLYTPLTKAAMRLCFEAHAGQLDKNGMPYVNHPLHLAEQMQGEDETCAALLHDVMEDCGRTPEDLLAVGMSERVVEALQLLTHRRGVPYLEYVRRLAGNDIARQVKLADLRHNSELARLDEVTDKDVRRLRKYMEARVILGDMAYALETPLGPVSVTVNGEPYPFAVREETHVPFAYAPFASFAGDGSLAIDADPTEEGIERVYRLEVDTLPLAVGDRMDVVCDFGDELVECGVVQGGLREVHVANGFVVGMELCDETAAPGMDACAYRRRDTRMYDIVSDPVGCRYLPQAHSIAMRVAWRQGAR